jgi:tape measure domain-containing protein
MAATIVDYILNLKDDNFLSGITDSQNATERLTSTVSSLTAAIGISFGIAGVVAFTKSVIDAGSSVEDMRVGLTTLLKDSAEAQQVIQQTMQDAMATPFGFETLLSANRALISTGMNSKVAREDVLNLANAVAASGGGNDELQRMVVNLQQIRNEGTATAMDLRQFSYAGINLYAALDAAGMHHAKGTTVSYEQISTALRKAHEEGGIYFHGLENMADNVSIKISNLVDAWFKFRVELFDNVRPAIIYVLDGLQNMLTSLQNIPNWLYRNQDGLKALAFGLGAAALGFIAVNAGAILSAAGAGLYASALWLVFTAQTAWNAAMTANPIGLVVVAIAGLVAGVVYAWEKFVGFRAVIMGTWSVIKEFASIVGDVYQGIYKQLHGVVTFDADEISAGFSQTINAYADAGTRIAGAFRQGYNDEIKKSEEEDKLETAALINAQKRKDLQKTSPVKSMSSASASASGSASSPIKSSATGTKSVVFNISINDLVKTFNVNISNVKDGVSQIRDAVTGVLVESINDFQRAIPN